MSYSIRRLYRFCGGVFSVAASSLLIAGLASCSSNSSNNASQPTLTLTPSSINLTAGAAGQQASLMLTAPTGSGAATVAVTGLPAGVTISPSTLSATPGVALAFTITAASSAATATATVSFSATLDGQTASAQASLAVKAAVPQADFSLSVQPAAVTLTANGTAQTVSVLATAANG